MKNSTAPHFLQPVVFFDWNHAWNRRNHKSPISHLKWQCLRSSRTLLLDRCMTPGHHPESFNSVTKWPVTRNPLSNRFGKRIARPKKITNRHVRGTSSKPKILLALVISSKYLLACLAVNHYVRPYIRPFTQVLLTNSNKTKWLICNLSCKTNLGHLWKVHMAHTGLALFRTC